MSKPLVSICLPNLNTRPFLEERVETILAQSLTDWELIISDNYSDDGSWEYFQSLRNDPRIHVSQAPRRGMYANWNECLRRAQGKYIYIATSDDTMMPTCLERLVAPLEDCPDLSLSVCDFDMIDDQGHIMPPPPSGQREYLGEWLAVDSIRNGLSEFIITSVFGTIWFTMTSVLFRRSLLNQTGLFRTDLNSVADEEWTLRACLGSDIAYTAQKLATWRKHALQATGNWKSRRQMFGWFYKALHAVLLDENAGLPSSWREDPAFLDALITPRRSAFWGWFELTRGDFRQAPLKFIGDCVAAARWAPDYLGQQLRHGFTLHEPPPVNHHEHTTRLLQWAGTPWPPIKR